MEITRVYAVMKFNDFDYCWEVWRLFREKDDAIECLNKNRNIETAGWIHDWRIEEMDLW